MDARFVHGADIDKAFAYFATDGGIIRVDIYNRKWAAPLTTALIPGEQIAFDTTFVVALESKKQSLWCGTTKGLLEYNTLSEDWDLHLLPTGSAPVLSIGFAGNDIWLEVGYKSQTWRSLLKGNVDFGNFELSNPSELAQAGNVAWRGERKTTPTEFPHYFTNDASLTFWPSGKLSDSNFKNYLVSDFINDPARRNSYIAFQGYGVGIIDTDTKRMEIFRQGPAWNRVKQVFKDGQTFYTTGNSFCKWERAQNRWSYYFDNEYSGLESDICYDVYKQGKTVYIAAEHGLVVYDESSRDFHNLTSLNNLWDSQVTALDGDAEELWIGTAQGINTMRYTGGAVERVKDESIRGRLINDIKIDGSFIWAAADYGIYLHDRKMGDWTYVPGSPEMHNSQAFQISVNKQKVWFAREDGIDCYDKTKGEFTAYQSVFFGSFQAYAVLAFDSLVWVGTNGGLYKLDTSQNRWAAFTKADGLPSNRVNSILREGDYLWLGTDMGLCRFFWNDPYRIN